MKKLLLLALLAGLVPSVFAQYTTVTGTVVDPIGIPYGYGTVLPILIFTGGTPQITTLNNANYSPPSQPSGMDISGTFTVNVASNATLIPAGSHWNFLVCSAYGALQHAVGRAQVCFQLASPLTISGTSEDISTQLNAVALPLTYLTAGGGGGTVTGSGTANTLAKWTSSTAIGNSGFTDDGAGNVAYTPTGLTLTSTFVGLFATGTVGLNGQGGSVTLQGVTSGSTRGGSIILTPGAGSSNNIDTDGVVAVESGIASNIFYLGNINFSGLATPATLPGSAGNRKQPMIICNDCRGAGDGAAFGSVAAGGGTGAIISYDGTNWRVL